MWVVMVMVVGMCMVMVVLMVVVILDPLPFDVNTIIGRIIKRMYP